MNVYAQSEYNILDELDPSDPNIEKIMEYYDNEYFKATGESPFINEGAISKGSCYRNACPVWAYVSLKNQTITLYENGAITHVWLMSSGKRGYTTPHMDRNPNGRVYDKYTSTIYPDGDYQGLGNMPYAVFVTGGYAIHGTTKGNWPYLGTPVSHGCMRLHPNDAFIFNRLVRKLGIGSVWVTVE
jgi:lipoprotein-anchoring transpeptidase ErfK/SrfK